MKSPVQPPALRPDMLAVWRLHRSAAALLVATTAVVKMRASLEGLFFSVQRSPPALLW